MLLEQENAAPSSQSDSNSIPLSALNYGMDEIIEVLDSLLSGQVTTGRKVARFESMWAEYLGCKHAVVVNSGSSANLAAHFEEAFHPTSPSPRAGAELVASSFAEISSWPQRPEREATYPRPRCRTDRRSVTHNGAASSFSSHCSRPNETTTMRLSVARPDSSLGSNAAYDG